MIDSSISDVFLFGSDSCRSLSGSHRKEIPWKILRRFFADFHGKSKSNWSVTCDSSPGRKKNYNKFHDGFLFFRYVNNSHVVSDVQ